jgi:hypothetical protein
MIKKHLPGKIERKLKSAKERKSWHISVIRKVQ